jgi:hypothetical protein
MASILFGNGVAGIKGSQAGTTYSQNANGAYTRNRTKPTNPKTSAQVNQRALLTGLSSAWRNLSAGERQTFIDGAPNFPYTNRLGQRSTYTGPQLYNKLNLALLSAGQPAINRCPSPQAFPSLGSGALSITTDGTTLTATVFFDNTFTNDFTCQAFASVGVSAGRNATSTPKKLVRTVLGSGSNAVPFGPGYVSVYGLPAVGENIVVEIKITNNSTGQQTTIFTGSAVVAEA